MYIGGEVTEDEHSGVVVRRLIQTGSNAQRKGEGITSQENVKG